MTSLGELLRSEFTSAESRTIPIRPEIPGKTTSRPARRLHDEQIHALVHELFLGREPGLIRNVAFAPVDSPRLTASLCLDVARTLASAGRHDVGLFDATSEPTPLHECLAIEAPVRPDVTWSIAPRLWLVPRESWWPEGVTSQPVGDPNLDRLREVMAEFDLSVLCCGTASWITARIVSACDGVVLVLTANKTRRLVATQTKERLEKMHVSVLGSVLLERRFPVPQGLYRSL
jgi:hypothetical protein